MKDRITITIKKAIWKKLSQLKLDRGFKTFDDVLENLLKKAKGVGKK